MLNFANQQKDRMYWSGILAILVSICFYCLPYFVAVDEDRYFGLFICNFVLAAGYFIVLLASGRLRKGRQGIYPLMLLLILFLISAYALNREMKIFEKSVNWFACVLVVLCFNYAAFAFYHQLPAFLQRLMLFISGAGLIVFLYLSFYLLPLYLIGVIAFFVLGISLHVFVPALLSIFTIKLVLVVPKQGQRRWRYFFAGALTVVIPVVLFCIQWTKTTNSINSAYRKATLEQTDGLPTWVEIAKKIPLNPVSERVLKSNLIYSISKDKFNDFFWDIPRRNVFDENLHDPLVMIASLFGGYPNIPENDQIQLLRVLYDKRHEAEERLWSGNNLYTEDVNTDVRLWPQFCLAYTEKLITVTNGRQRSGWRDQQEAIYTFLLPEGSVVTALSLWVNGKEEKAILTSRQKADSAYRTIVGIESRDPSVVHWLEGNRVLVRVFPVIAGESRKFRIGITSPLSRREGKMIYEDISFKGPSPSRAENNISVRFEQPAADIILPVSLQNSMGEYRWKGKYRSGWSITMSEQPIDRQSFSFDGMHYGVRPYEKQKEQISINTVYLDINKAWSREEFEKIWHAVRDRKVFVYTGKLVAVTEETRLELFRQLSSSLFSLFPLFEVENPSASLVITKSNGLSPNFGDIQNAPFGVELKKYMKDHSAIRLFNLGNNLSPYLKTLKEYRTFLYDSGNADELVSLLSSNQFVKSIESDQQIVIDNAGIAITANPGESSEKAPDHLMRLFAYNHILQKRGRDMFGETAWEDELVVEARKAYVVTPVSSLVVLETQKDYDRFDIKDEGNSLKNASASSNGAVPEPHEWALILLVLLIVSYIRFPNLFKSKRNS